MTDSTKTYSEMLKGELLAVARRLGLTNLSRLNKDEIVDLIKRAVRRSKAAKTPAKRGAQGAKAGAKTATKTSPRASKTTSKPTATKKTTASKTTTSKTTTTKTTASKAPASETTATKTTTAAVKKVAPAAAGKPKPNTTDVPKRSMTYRAPKEASLESTVERARYDRAGTVSAQADAVASKYGTAAEYKPEELQGVDEGLPDLPESYGDNRIVLLPRDPAWLFAYWNLTYEYKEAARAAGGKVLALRLNDVTDVEFDGVNAHASHEHECAEWARSWYLPVPAAGRDYLVEIGYRGGEDWFPLARSKRVSVPADQPTTWIRNDFVTIGFDEDLRAVRQRMPVMERPAETALPVVPQTIYDDGDLRIVVGGPFYNPSGVPSWPLFSHAILAAGVPGSLQRLPGSLGQVPGSLQHLPGSLGQVPGSLQHLAGSLGQVAGSLGQMGQLTRNPNTVGGGDMGSRGTTLDGRVFAGQPVLLEDTVEPMLQAAVELVVSGRSFPGTEISVAGHGVPTGPDGAFSLRVCVPEGMRDLPIEAKSLKSGVTRRLVLRFGRDLES